MASGSETAGRWAIGTFLFLLAIWFVIIMIANAGTWAGTGSNVTVSGYSGLNRSTESRFAGSCSDPRYYLDATGTPVQFASSTASISCETAFAYNQTQCESVPNCRWEVVTSGFWWWQTSNTSCTGLINVSYLANGNATPIQNATYPHSSYIEYGGLFGGKYLGRYYYNAFSLLTTETVSVCESPLAQNNSASCQQLGCTWTLINEKANAQQTPSIGNIVGFMFGFNADLLDMPQPWYTFFVTLFSWLPTFVLLVAIAIYIRG